MTPEAQRIALCDFLKWKPPYVMTTQCEWMDTKSNIMMFSDPLEDLNAMHEAENCIMGETSSDANHIAFRYSHELYSVVVPLNQQPFRATAAQRAEAFLRALKLWKD